MREQFKVNKNGSNPTVFTVSYSQFFRSAELCEATNHLPAFCFSNIYLLNQQTALHTKRTENSSAWTQTGESTALKFLFNANIFHMKNIRKMGQVWLNELHRKLLKNYDGDHKSPIFMLRTDRMQQ